jgi:hypothetical protein
MTLNTAGQLSGSPSTAGTYSISVTVTDSATPPQTATAPVRLVVKDTTIVIAPASPPAGTVGYPYPGFSFSASGGSPPYTWQSSGALPPGLTLSVNGMVEGTPKQAGTFSFSVTATETAQQPMTSPALAAQIQVNNPLKLMLNAMPAPPDGVDGRLYGRFSFNATGGFPPLQWSITAGSLPPGLTLGSDGSLSGVPRSTGTFVFTVTVADSAPTPVSSSQQFKINVAPPPPLTFTMTPGGMLIGRAGHTATVLLTGKVLVTGGDTGMANQADQTAELYDPVTGTFSSTAGNMTEARGGHTATLLKLSSSTLKNYGKVLIVGSVDTTAELYDPASATFAATGSMHHARTSPTATLLNTDKVLIVGGNTSSGDLTAELYDPATGTFYDAGSTTILRTGHTSTRLLDGRVLIAGGTGTDGTGTSTAELYDPTLGTFTVTASNMMQARAGHTATLLGAADAAQNGSVLIVGNALDGADNSAELYDPNTQTFARLGSGSPRTGHSASLRNDGTVLVAGGLAATSTCRGVPRLVSQTKAELFAPGSDGFTITGSLNVARYAHTATVLQDGTVVVIGGYDREPPHPIVVICPQSTSLLHSAELFK